jgi:lipopolysaccharide/colanic/teichoic acid biosynthesis glycosyltransferase
LFAIVALLIKLDSPGPVIFKQQRVGKDGRLFDVLKFRSMIEGAEQMQADLEALNEVDGPLFKVRQDPRVTRVGKWLRRTSIDELPQLVNVLRGEMSIVGPRPGTPEEVAQYEPWQMQRISVPPGITGLWQVSGRSEVPFDEMVLLDIFYIENWSLDLEIRILLQTIPYVLLGHGAY